MLHLHNSNVKCGNGLVLGEISFNQSLSRARPAGGKSNIAINTRTHMLAILCEALSVCFAALSFLMQLSDEVIFLIFPSLNVLVGPHSRWPFCIFEAFMSLVGC